MGDEGAPNGERHLPILAAGEALLRGGGDTLVVLEGPEGSTVWHALRDLGVAFEAPCGGLGRCGSCRVRLSGAVSPPDDQERALLGDAGLAQGYRLACRALLQGQVEVECVPQEGAGHGEFFEGPGRQTNWQRVELRMAWGSLGRAGSLSEALRQELACRGQEVRQISRTALRQASRLWRPGEPGHFFALIRDQVLRGCLAPGKRPLGYACDLGTTTVAVYLVDLVTGQLLGNWSSRNPQGVFGADVVSRMGAALESPRYFEELCRSLRREVDTLMERGVEAQGASFDEVLEMVVVGNPPMNHFFLGYAPSALSRDPFVCVDQAPEILAAGCLGLGCAPDMPVRFLPMVGGYVGSDMVGVLLAIDALPPEKKRLVVDFGTNGEMALVWEELLWVTSAAAGPAFEGGHITQGMSARPGALHGVYFRNGDLVARTVGDVPPRGLCGSGLIDAVVALREAGVLDATGCLSSEHLGDAMERRLRFRHGERGMLLASGEEGEVVLWQRDIRELQLAKAAIQVGLQKLLAEGGVGAHELDECVLTGAFGAGVRPGSIQRLGVVPSEFRGTFLSLEDAAGLGALRVLLEGDAAERRARELAARATLVSLTEDPNFPSLFVAATAFPELP